MTKREELRKSLEDKEYRREFGDDVETTLAFQIRALREKHGWTRRDLAIRTGSSLAAVVLWEDPDGEPFTLQEIKNLAKAFDVALIVRFAPFSELIDWLADLTPDRLSPQSFDEEERSS
jgi:transcriptional regulator with XRE-family HTH domain